MPVIACDIRVGRTKEQKRQLAMGLTKAVQEATGVSIDYIFLVMRGEKTRFVGTLTVGGGKRRLEGATGNGTLTGTRYTPLSVGADLVSDYTVNVKQREVR